MSQNYHKPLILLCIAAVFAGLLILSGCSGSSDKKNEGPPANTSSPQAQPVKEEIRTITDLTGAEVTIPVAKNIEKVVIIAPPIVSTYLSIVHDNGKLVGTHQMAFVLANEQVLSKLLPNWQQINTTFLTGFSSNAEELLKLDPNIILVWGAAQKEGLENIKIPIVDFYQPSHENEEWSVNIDRLMRDIFQMDSGKTLQDEWNITNEIVSAALTKIDESKKKTAIMIMNNTGDTITVRGGGTHGDDWLQKSGLKNAAETLTGGDYNQVTMEQIYEWNPDIIYLFQGNLDNEAYLSNSISGQDWSKTKAFENKTIYDMPVGIINWGTPSSDSPLTLEWLVMTSYPDTINESVFLSRMKTYYEQHYNIILTDELIQSILNP
ncbi:ABC transporter substrate-binding protein [Paenibacillus sp. GXUN7292]|uniref:ABC transporter substrate-binding protein n=1 Tax=Paenibacillus sp. GXUN7292 TaxID=3422499 RepID=UPI003D7C5999